MNVFLLKLATFVLSPPEHKSVLNVTGCLRLQKGRNLGGGKNVCRNVKSYLVPLLAGRYEIRDIHLVEESVLESLKVKADFHNFKPRPFNMREFYDRTGHDINDMLLSCHFHGTECRAEDFKVVSSLSYSCY